MEGQNCGAIPNPKELEVGVYYKNKRNYSLLSPITQSWELPLYGVGSPRQSDSGSLGIVIVVIVVIIVIIVIVLVIVIYSYSINEFFSESNVSNY